MVRKDAWAASRCFVFTIVIVILIIIIIITTTTATTTTIIIVIIIIIISIIIIIIIMSLTQSYDVLLLCMEWVSHTCFIREPGQVTASF